MWLNTAIYRCFIEIIQYWLYFKLFYVIKRDGSFRRIRDQFLVGYLQLNTYFWA